MANGSIKAVGSIYRDFHDGDLEFSTNSDLGLSLTLPPGSYAVTINCSFVRKGSSGTAYTKLFLTVGSAQLDSGSTQGSSDGSSRQIPLSTTFYISLTETTVVKPYLETSQAVNCFDYQSIDAIKIS